MNEYEAAMQECHGEIAATINEGTFVYFDGDKAPAVKGNVMGDEVRVSSGLSIHDATTVVVITITALRSLPEAARRDKVTLETPEGRGDFIVTHVETAGGEVRLDLKNNAASSEMRRV